MDIDRHVESLTRQLEAAAATGTPKVREAAEHLAAALGPAARMVLAEAMADAAEEISQGLAPGAVDARLRGRDVEFVVSVPRAAEQEHDDALERAQAHAATVAADTTRTTVRIPDGLKQRAELAAAAEGISLNTWVVQAVSLHLEPGPRSRRGRAAARYAGWAEQRE